MSQGLMIWAKRGSDMGGLGSGWRISKKDVVEDCLVLSANHFVSKDDNLAGS
jgi:hypothetical protein